MAQQRTAQGNKQGKAQGLRNPRQDNQQRQNDTPVPDADPPRKPTEREGRPEAPRKEPMQTPATNPDRAQPATGKDDADDGTGGDQRDTLHVPVRTN